MCDLLYTMAEDVVKKTYNEHSRSTNEQKDVEVTSSKAHTNYATRDKECLRAGKMHKLYTTAEDVVKKTYSEHSRFTNVTRDRECLRAGKMNKQQKNIMSMAGQTSVGKYSTTLW